MKKLILVAFCLFATIANAQTVKQVDGQEYQKLKSENKLDPNAFYQISNTNKYIVGPPSHYNGVAKVDSSSGTCGCSIPLDNSFLVCDFTDGFPPDYREDDGSTPVKFLPFTFCFYGTNYNAVYINRNGNVTFLTPNAVFSATGFPVAGDVMIAPFWADVDTRNLTSGLVYYKITSNYMIVKWDAVGYYNSMADKLNTFQLIISDGTDTIIPANNNIAFCYGDMQWTTGSASGGTNGFGGTAATVGANSGNGVNFIQFGRFDQAGTAYDGPYLLNDGVSWLDNQEFYFDVCGSSSNLPPLPLGGATQGCGPADTLQLCSNTDTLYFSVSFTGPENGQTVAITTTAPTLGANCITTSNTAGNITTANVMIIGNPGLVGTHLITITATDNGTPSLSTSISYIVNIPAVTVNTPTLTVTPSTACMGTPVTVTLQNCSQYSNILWSDGSTGCSINVTANDTIFATIYSLLGCQKTTFQPVVFQPNPIPTITGNPTFCGTTGTVLTATLNIGSSPISTYSWNVPGSTNTNTVLVTSPGQVTLNVTDVNGCTGSTTFTVSNIAPTVSINSSLSSFCPGQPVTLTATLAGATYAWAGPGGPFPATQVITVNPVATSTYSITATANGCSATNTITLTPLSTPTVTGTASTYCAGQSSTVTANVNPVGSYNYTWSGGATAQSFTTTTGGTYTVTASVNGQCPGVGTVTVPSGNTNPIATLNTQTGQPIVCFKGSQIITSNVGSGSPSYTYQWSPPVTGQSGTAATYSVTNPGVYQLIVSDQNGCKDTATITLTQIVPTVNITGNNLICKGDTANLIAHGNSTTPVTYAWTPASMGTNDSISTTMNGNYAVTITDQNGCTATAISSVNYYPVPTGSISASPVSPGTFGNSVTFTPYINMAFGYVNQFSWVLGDGNTTNNVTGVPVTHTYGAPGTYNITLYTVSNYGCLDTITTTYDVQVLIPIINIFTPNGDGVNEFLEFKGIEYFPENTLTITNRWGKKLYEKKGYANTWTGEGFSEGTYYYILEVPGLKPEENLKGFFQLSR